MFGFIRSFVLLGALAACATTPGEIRWQARELETSVPTFVSGLAVAADEGAFVAVLGNEARGYAVQVRDLTRPREVVTMPLPLTLSADDAALGSTYLVLAGQADAHSQGSSIIALRAPISSASKNEIRRQSLMTFGRAGPVEAFAARIALSPSEAWVAAVAKPVDKVTTPPESELGSVAVFALPELDGTGLTVPGTHRCTEVTFPSDAALIAACRTVAGEWVLGRWQRAAGSWEALPPVPVFPPGQDPAWQLAAFSAGTGGDYALGWQRDGAGAVTWQLHGRAYVVLPVSPVDVRRHEDEIQVLGTDGSIYRVTLPRAAAVSSVERVVAAPTAPPADVPPPRGALSASGRVALVAAHGLDEGQAAEIWVGVARP